MKVYRNMSELNYDLSMHDLKNEIIYISRGLNKYISKLPLAKLKELQREFKIRKIKIKVQEVEDANGTN